MDKPLSPGEWVALLFAGSLLLGSIALGLVRLRARIKRRATKTQQTTTQKTPVTQHVTGYVQQGNSVAQHTGVITTNASAQGKPLWVKPNTTTPTDANPVTVLRHARSITDVTPEQRQHTLVAARTGDGKTTTINTLLVNDIAGGYNVVVCNPHFTYWHPIDQPIDLRPLREHFTVVFEYAEIVATLEGLCQLIEERKPLYRDGKDVGAVVVVYIDEWPAIVEEPTYGKRSVTAVQKIVREGRKYNIFVALFAQDALVDTLGFKSGSGVRANFATRLLGNVDKTTWSVLTNGEPQQPVTKGTWYASGNVNGIVGVQLPSANTIASVVAMPVAPPITTPQPQSTNTTDGVLEQMVDILAENPRASQREIERELFGYNGGDAYVQVSARLATARQLAATTTTK